MLVDRCVDHGVYFVLPVRAKQILERDGFARVQVNVVIRQLRERAGAHLKALKLKGEHVVRAGLHFIVEGDCHRDKLIRVSARRHIRFILLRGALLCLGHARVNLLLDLLIDALLEIREIRPVDLRHAGVEQLAFALDVVFGKGEHARHAAEHRDLRRRRREGGIQIQSGHKQNAYACRQAQKLLRQMAFLLFQKGCAHGKFQLRRNRGFQIFLLERFQLLSVCFHDNASSSVKCRRSCASAL